MVLQFLMVYIGVLLHDHVGLSFSVGVLEGESAGDEGVEDDARWPHINLLAVPLSQKYFRRNIRRRAARLVHLLIRQQNSGLSKICDLNICYYIVRRVSED